ncbi:MAG TPA: hypothetical protein VFI24_15150 [Pyrinomonadaceae bacterium]|nr:hypothetical protein [Pyrinomonadaceae bacterium]
MKRLVTRTAVAFLTFSLGVVLASLSPLRFSQSIPEEKPPQPVIVSTKPLTTRSAKVEWRRVNIGRVSFSLPAHLRKTGPPSNIGVIHAFGGPFVGQVDFYVYYTYGREVNSDYNVPAGTRTDLLIDDKPAKLYVVEFNERMLMSWKDRPEMHLVVVDVGDGHTKFEMYASSFDTDLMKQIMDSVHIR